MLFIDLVVMECVRVFTGPVCDCITGDGGSAVDGDVVWEDEEEVIAVPVCDCITGDGESAVDGDAVWVGEEEDEASGELVSTVDGKDDDDPSKGTGEIWWTSSTDREGMLTNVAFEKGKRLS